MHRLLWCVAALLVVSGCTGRKSSLLLERHARGPMSDMTMVGHRIDWKLEPLKQTQEQQGIEVTVEFASREYLKELYGNKKLFGPYAGKEPFFPENLVFYIQVHNKATERIWMNPVEFVVVDDRGNQYATIDADYLDVLAESRQPWMTTTRGMLEDARPGYFGLSVPVGKLVAQKSQGRFALIKQSSLQLGYLYPGVTHDGVLAFWSPVGEAKSLTLFVSNIKTDFDAANVPQTTLEFPFTFHVLSQ